MVYYDTGCGVTAVGNAPGPCLLRGAFVVCGGKCVPKKARREEISSRLVAYMAYSTQSVRVKLSPRCRV